MPVDLALIAAGLFILVAIFIYNYPKKPNLPPEVERILRQYSTRELMDIRDQMDRECAVEVFLPDKQGATRAP